MERILFHALAGQDKAKRMLLSACQRERVSHAYLFQGPSGVGRRQMAFAFAAYLNCLAPTEHDSCGQCGSCKKIAAANHPDIVTIEPDGALIKINQIRELKKTLAFPPFEARYRVVFIADIHETMRRKEVANSLLKTLEEPPAHTVFLMTTEEAVTVLATIASRCQKVPFYPLPPESLCQALIAEGIGQEAALSLASVGEGSLGRAKAYAEKNFLGLRREVVSLLSSMQADQPAAVEVVFTLAEKTAKLQDDMSDFFGLLKLWVRDLMLMVARVGPEHLMNHDLKDLYPQVNHRWNLLQLSAKVRCIDQAETQLRHNCNKTLVCEVLYWKLLQ